jgi:hypothetical protein
VKIRELHSSDRGDVLEISRHVWEGHDYLPAVFESLLNDENGHFYGVEVDDRVVVVANLRLLESGRTGSAREMIELCGNINTPPKDFIHGLG